MKIAVDIDDTLNVVDRVRYASEYIRRNALPFRLVNADADKLSEAFDWGHEDVVRFIREGGGITAFTDAPARKNAAAVLAEWRAAGHEITVLTSRPAVFFGNPEKLSRDWLEKRHIPYDVLVAACENKAEYCVQHGIEILIDNNLGHCLAAQESGVYAVLFVGRSNVKDAARVRYGGATWRQVEAVVRHIFCLANCRASL